MHLLICLHCPLQGMRRKTMSAWFTFECLAQYLKHHKIAVTINVMNNICEKHTFPGGLVVKELALSLLLASCHCCCSGPAPGLRMSTCGGCSQKKKKKVEVVCKGPKSYPPDNKVSIIYIISLISIL